MASAPRPHPPTIRVPPQVGLRVSPEQFAALVAANQDVKLERSAQGLLIVNPPTGGETGRRNFNITGQLSAWGAGNGAIGVGFDSSTGFVLPNGANRSPDAAWVRQDRWCALSLAQREGFIPLCPDFVVELRSRTDNLKALQAKMQEYLDNGTQLGWLIDPHRQRVTVYRSGQRVETLERPMTLSGEAVLPGFTLNLSGIWP